MLLKSPPLTLLAGSDPARGLWRQLCCVCVIVWQQLCETAGRRAIFKKNRRKPADNFSSIHHFP